MGGNKTEKREGRMGVELPDGGVLVDGGVLMAGMLEVEWELTWPARMPPKAEFKDASIRVPR